MITPSRIAGPSVTLPEYAIDPGPEFAPGFARQILSTVRSVVDRDPSTFDALDVGSGYGYTSAELARSCRSVVGIEPSPELHASALRLLETSQVTNLVYRQQSIYELTDRDLYDLVVLDNVLEHLPDQGEALRRISDAMRPGACLYILVPNKLWPVEHHYSLPFLGWLPLPIANRYLRLSGRGQSYAEASYAPTVGRLRRLLRQRRELRWQFALPADISLAQCGGSTLYRAGVGAIRRWPALWWISKALLVVAVKEGQ